MKNKTLYRIYKMLKPQIKAIVIISILAIIINIGEVVKPYLIKIVIDDYLSIGVWQKGVMTIGIIGAIYIAILLIGNILDFIVTTTTSMLGESVIYSLRNKLFKYIQLANITFHDKTSSGTLFVRITSDVEDIINFFKDIITTFVKDIVMIIVIAIMMATLDYKLSLLCFCILPFVLLTSIIITHISKKVQEYSKRIKTKLNIFLAESIYGIKVIKIFNRQFEKNKECSKLCNDFYKSRIPTSFTEGLLVALMVIFENLGVALIVWANVKHILNINLDVGVIYIFITYLKQIYEPIQRIVENFETVQEAFVSINKIYEILEKEEYLEDYKSGIQLQEIKGKIEFKNVWFAYVGEEWVLKNVSFVIEPGESIALVGRTGSGKTTIINLINRFYEIQKGEILIDGINIKDINLRSLRSKIGIVLQEPFIFAKSIKDNIQLNENLSDEAIMETIRLSSAEEFIESLPNGIDEIAHERGSSFSAGQKQLIAFARIFAHDPSIFILDEATANIDTKTEELIQESISIISKEKTSIFIAHRLSTIINVDKIIVLKIENGYYNKLYTAYYNSLAV